MYESYADMGLNEWIKIKIIVKGKQAKLFLNDNKQPSLVVNDLKLGVKLLEMGVNALIGDFPEVLLEAQKRFLHAKSS